MPAETDSALSALPLTKTSLPKIDVSLGAGTKLSKREDNGCDRSSSERRAEFHNDPECLGDGKLQTALCCQPREWC